MTILSGSPTAVYGVERALSKPSFTARRSAMRALFNNTHAAPRRVDGVYTEYPKLITIDIKMKNACDHREIASTVSNIRDRLSVDVLAALILGYVSSRHIRDAISSGTEPFGRPATMIGTGDYNLPSNFLVAHLKRDFSPAQHEEYNAMTSTSAFEFNLSNTTTIADHLHKHCDFDYTHIFKNLGQYGVPEDVLEGVRLLIELREDDQAEIEVEDIISDTPEADVVNKFCHDWADGAEPVQDDAVAAYTVPTDSQLIDLALNQVGLPPIGKLIGEINDASVKIAAAEESARLVAAASVQPVEAASDGSVPSGRVVLKKASEVFGIKGAAAQSFDFNVPTWEWDGPHPLVPDLDKNYVFRGRDLLRVLYAIVANKRMYLHGHSGSGKTTLIEQVAAYLNWPAMRLNFDSEVSRIDLIGRDTLVEESGTTVSKFVDGILPQMLSGPHIAIFDELDFVRPDVAYVMQRVFEGNGLLLTEDGGRLVKPHPMFRMFATGNTVGQGDEFGMYQGARPQSMAMLDRFTVWAKIDYLNKVERKRLMKKRVPSLDGDLVDKVNKYVGEHLEAFQTSKVMQPITPRGYLDLCESVAMFLTVFPAGKEDKAITEAFEMTVLDRATAQDRAVLKGLANRVFA